MLFQPQTLTNPHGLLTVLLMIKLMESQLDLVWEIYSQFNGWKIPRIQIDLLKPYNNNGLLLMPPLPHPMLCNGEMFLSLMKPLEPSLEMENHHQTKKDFYKK